MSGSPDEIHDPIQMHPDILGGEPNDPHALFAQPRCAPRVVRDLLGTFVALTVDFDGQLRCRAVEVENVRADRMLQN